MFENTKQAILETTFQEWLAVLFAVIYVFLIAKKIIWCWLFGILSSAIYVYICYTGKLYLESILSFFYVLMGFYGWMQWNKKSNKNVAIIFLNKKQMIQPISLLLIISVLVGFIFDRYTDNSLPYLDASITLFSFYATWLAAKKYIENWLFWIFIDAASILLFANRGFYLSAALYLLYTILAIYGYLQWRKAIVK